MPGKGRLGHTKDIPAEQDQRDHQRQHLAHDQHDPDHHPRAVVHRQASNLLGDPNDAARHVEYMGGLLE